MRSLTATGVSRRQPVVTRLRKVMRRKKTLLDHGHKCGDGSFPIPRLPLGLDHALTDVAP